MPVLTPYPVRGEGPEAGPLDLLVHRLISRGPPQVSGILSAIVPEEGFPEFVALIQEFLPDHTTEILAAPGAATQIALFGNRFRDQYFPIAFDGDWMYPDLEYTDLLHHIPINYGGVEYEDFHEPSNWRDGYILMGSIFVPDRFGSWDEGVAMVWLEQAGTLLDQESRRRIPQEGISAEELHRLLDGTDYQTVALFADYLCNDTGNAFLDAHPEYPLMDLWDRETVTILTRDYARSQVMWGQMEAMAEWLESDTGVNFNLMMDFIEERLALPRGETGAEAEDGDS